PASALARTRRAFDGVELVGADLARVTGADGLEHVLHGESPAAILAVHDRAAVEHHARQVEPRHRHHHRRDGLVAARDAHEGVEEVPAHHQLDGVGDPVTADERGLHALGSHRDAIGHRDRVELDRRTAGGPDPFLHLLGQLAVVCIARRELDPAVGHTDERLLEVFVGEADGSEVGARGGPVGAVEKDTALVPGIESHAGLLATRNVKRPRWATSPRWSMISWSSMTMPPSRIARRLTTREVPWTVSPMRRGRTNW